MCEKSPEFTLQRHQNNTQGRPPPPKKYIRKDWKEKRKENPHAIFPGGFVIDSVSSAVLWWTSLNVSVTRGEAAALIPEGNVFLELCRARSYKQSSLNGLFFLIERKMKNSVLYDWVFIMALKAFDPSIPGVTKVTLQLMYDLFPE